MTNTQKMRNAMVTVNRQTLAAGVIFFLSLIPAACMDRAAGMVLGAEAALCMGMIAMRSRRQDAIRAEWEADMQAAVLRMAWAGDEDEIRVVSEEMPTRVSVATSEALAA